MVPKFTTTILLPGSKTADWRSMRWAPVCHGVGVLELTDPKSQSRYAVCIQPFGGVRLTKRKGADNYVVTRHTCECAGFVYSEDAIPCKHILAVRILLDRGWMLGDERETVRDLDAEADERDRYYESGEPPLAELCGVGDGEYNW